MSDVGRDTAEPAPPWPRGMFQAAGRFVFRFRDYLAPAGLAVALALTRPQAPFGSQRADTWLDALGVLVAAVGQALRATVIGYAYIKRGGADKRLAAPRLVAEGFYAHSRNPMYLGNFLLLAGLAIIYNSLVVYAVVLPLYIVALLSIVNAEEEFLARRFREEYADYCRRVPRFLPRLQGLPATLASMRFDWRRVLRKEYGTTTAWISVAIFLMIWERLARVGYAAAATQIHWLLAAYVPVVLAWATVRRLKKTGRLRSPD